MSWSFNYEGKAGAVRKAVTVYAAHLSHEGEQKSMESIKAAVLADLSMLQDSQGVRVEASGSVYGEPKSVRVQSSHKVQSFNLLE